MENSEQIFQDLDTKDPQIKVKGNIASLCPNYLNYSFLSTLIAIIIFLLIYFSYDRSENFWVDKINLYFLLVIIFFPILLIMELRFYNTVVINFDERIITIFPNPILRLVKKKRIFSFSDIRRIEPMQISGLIGLRIRYRGFAIGLVLKNSDEIKVISMNSYNIAKDISKRLSTVIVK